MICLDAHDDYALSHRTRAIAEMSNKYETLRHDHYHIISMIIYMLFKIYHLYEITSSFTHISRDKMLLK